MAKAGKCSAEAQTPFKTTIFGRVLRLHPKSESWLKGLIAQVRPTVSPQLGPRTEKRVSLPACWGSYSGLHLGVLWIQTKPNGVRATGKPMRWR